MGDTRKTAWPQTGCLSVAEAPAILNCPKSRLCGAASRPQCCGARIDKVELRRADIRFPFPVSFAKRLTGQRIVDVRRRADISCSNWTAARPSSRTWACPVRSAWKRPRFQRRASSITNESKDPKHDHVVLVLDNGWVVAYNDPRRFGFMDLAPTGELDQHPRMRGLGAEPLGARLDAARLAALFDRLPRARWNRRCSTRSASRAWATSMCARPCSGRDWSRRGRRAVLANARGGPARAATAVAKAIRDVLEEAVEAGGSTLRDHRQANGELGYFQHVFQVYDREGSAVMRKGCQRNRSQGSPRSGARHSTARNASASCVLREAAIIDKARRGSYLTRNSV